MKEKISWRAVSVLRRFMVYALICAMLFGSFQSLDVHAATKRSAGIKTTVSCVSSWSSGTDKYYQIQVQLDNPSNDAVSGWTVTMDLPSDAEFSQGWNGIATINKGKLKVTPYDYNKTIYGR